jgi:hypothetical protein
MKLKLFIIILILFFASEARAQTSTSTIVWTMNDVLSDAQGFVYNLKTDATAPVLITPVTCALVATVVNCSGPVATPTPGQHTWILIASTADGTLSAASAPVTGTMPAVPGGIKVSVKLTFP